MSTLPQPLQFTSLMIVSLCSLGCCLLCVCVNPAAALSWLMWCQQLLQKWIYAQGAHIRFLWTSWIQICLSQTHGFNPVKISLAFLHYHCNGNLLPFYFKALQKLFPPLLSSPIQQQKVNSHFWFTLDDHLHLFCQANTLFYTPYTLICKPIWDNLSNYFSIVSFVQRTPKQQKHSIMSITCSVEGGN